jgi:peptidoglycan/xylan/chitin deacetylase (PgdA/CDA1 family)
MTGNSVLNVCFHGIGTPRRELEPGEDVYWIGASQFLLLLDEIATWPSVRISFDDANESDVQIALPALVERGLSAQFFLVAGRLGAQGSLAVDDVRELASKGMAIGTHGMSHRPWLAMTSEIREAELVEARQRIEDAAGKPVTEAACPLGRYDRRLLADLRRLGYRRVYTSDRSVARQDSWLQPRFSLHREDTPESVRAAVLTRPRLVRRAQRSAKGMVKRLR